MDQKNTLKEKLLSEVDSGYIREVLLAVNNTPRYEVFSKSDSSLIEFASRKFTIDQVNVIRRNFVWNRPATGVGSMFRDKNGKELGDIFIDYVKPTKFAKEFRANGRLCDIAYLNKDGLLVAVEIKANGDKVANAVSQCEDYSAWANMVYLLIEKKKLADLSKIEMPRNVGIVVFDGKKFVEVRKAKQVDHGVDSYIDLLNASSVRKLSSELHLSTRGTKSQLKERVNNALKPSNGVLAKNAEKAVKNALFLY